MRRKERAVTDAAKLEEIVQKCQCCRIGLADNGQVYIVPLSFGYVKENGQYTLYFHSAKEGRKMDLIRKSPEAGFEMDTDYALKTAGSACGHSAYFKSIIGCGRIYIVEDAEEKKLGLRAIMEHTAGTGDWEFTEKMLDAVCVLKLIVSEMSGKENEPCL